MITIRKLGKHPTALRSSIFREELERATSDMIRNATDDFNRTTATWDHKVKFTAKIERSVGQIKISIMTDDLIYKFVDEGTKPHLIPKQPKVKGSLAWQPGSKPKTEPDVVLSTPGAPGKGWRFAKQVHHPGTKARHFTKWIKKKWDPELKRQIDNALDRFERRINAG